MGLAITAYSKVELLEVLTDSDEFEDKYPYREGKQDGIDLVSPGYADADYAFPERLGSIKPGGVYRYQIKFNFRAGSYSGYNIWRNQLSLMALGVPAKDVWRNEKKYIEAPFFLLIHFSDCEGVLGPECAKLLAADFANFQEKADAQPQLGFIGAYNDWRKACELDSQGGYLSFH